MTHFDNHLPIKAQTKKEWSKDTRYSQTARVLILEHYSN